MLQDVDSGLRQPRRVHYFGKSSVETSPRYDNLSILVLELAFATKELRSVCEDSARALEQYGPEIASALWGRIADLRAASSALDLPFATSRPGTAADCEHVVVQLAAGYSLVLASNHRRTPLKDDDSVAWERVSRVMVLRIDSVL